jgi:hypothetical protein
MAVPSRKRAMALLLPVHICTAVLSFGSVQELFAVCLLNATWLEATGTAW